MVGTHMRQHDGPAEQMKVTPADRRDFLAILNQAHPTAKLGLDDIDLVHAGLLPAENRDLAPGETPQLLEYFQIFDHAKTDGVMTVLGVKYTTARDVAQKTIARIHKKIGHPPHSSPVSGGHFPGGDFADGHRLVEEALQSGIPQATATHLVRHYGTQYRAVFELGASTPLLRAPLSDASPVIGAEVIYGIREEMALTLPDIMLRRKELGSACMPDDQALKNAAELMAHELGWDEVRREKEIEAVKKMPNRWGGKRDGER